MQNFITLLTDKIIPEVVNRVYELRKSSPQKSDALEKLAKEIQSSIDPLHHAKSFFSDENILRGNDSNTSDGMSFEQWQGLITDEIFSLNKFGPDCITSCWEGLLKTQTLAKIFNQESQAFRPLYRGQVNYDWLLISSFGRKNTITDEMKKNLLEVTELELSGLKKFQKLVKSNELLHTEIFDEKEGLGEDDPSWWSAMQHYNQGHGSVGTRMLDVTSSIFVGLYFACADLDGTVNEGADGKLYFWTDVPGRPEAESVDRHRGTLIDYRDESGKSVMDYYRIEAHPDTPRFREPAYRTPRVLSQYGYFIWQPKYWEPITNGQRFRFRIPGCCKKKILKELIAMGYGADRVVLGALSRARAEETLAKTLSA